MTSGCFRLHALILDHQQEQLLGSSLADWFQPGRIKADHRMLRSSSSYSNMNMCNPFLPLLKLPQIKKNIGLVCHFLFFWLGTIGFLIVVIENQDGETMVSTPYEIIVKDFIGILGESFEIHFW